MKGSHLRQISVGLFMLLLAGLKPANAQVQSARYISMTSNTHAFYEYLPQGYGTSSTKYPLMIFIHGIGELGAGTSASLPLVLRNGPPNLANAGKFPTSFTVNGQTYSFIILSPQFVAWPTSTDIDQVITYAEAHYNVDPSKIYITGLSMGGGCTWDYPTNNSGFANRVAAIVPVCGASWPDVNRARVMSNANLPVWALQNLNDPTVPSSYTVNWINYINQAPAPNPNARKTIFNASGHNAWSQAYNPLYRESFNGVNKNVYEFMLSYSRGGAVIPNQPPTVTAGSNVTITLPVNSTHLTATAKDVDGTIASYSWKQTAGPSTSTISSTTISNPIVSNLISGTYTYNVVVSDNKGATANSSVSVIVIAVNQPPTVTAGSNVTITLPTNSTPLTATAKDVDGTIASYSWKQTAGPSTSTISSTTISNPIVSNLISGTYTYNITVTDNKGATANSSVSVIVNPNVTKTTSSGHLPGKIEAETFVTMGGGVHIESCNEGGQDVGYIFSKDWMNYNVVVDTAGTYTVSFRVASPNSNTQLELWGPANNVLTTVTVPQTGGWQTYATVTSTVTLNAGAQTLKIYASVGGWNFNWMQFTKSLSTSSASLGAIQAKTSTASNSSFSIYPNPVLDKFQLSVNSPNTGNMLITIKDASGSVKQTFNVMKDQAGTTQTYLSIGSLITGNYVMTVQIGQWSNSQNFTKQ